MRFNIILISILFSFKSYSTCTYTAIQDGEWGEPSTWEKTDCTAGSPDIPSDNSIIIIPQNTTITIEDMYELNNVTINISGILFFISGKKIELDCFSYLEVLPGGTLNGQTNGSKIGYCNSGWVWSGTLENGPFTIGIVPLPITLIQFDLKIKPKHITVFWSTSSEHNNAYFEVLHSTNGINWEHVGIIEGAGNSQVEIRYSYDFHTKIKGVHFFQLRQVDYDGKSSLSEIKSILFEGSTTAEVYPNPANQITTLNFDKSSIRNIQLLNSEGKSLENHIGNNKSYTLKTSHLENGVYTILIDGEMHSKLIIQH